MGIPVHTQYFSFLLHGQDFKFFFVAPPKSLYVATESILRKSWWYRQCGAKLLFMQSNFFPQIMQKTSCGTKLHHVNIIRYLLHGQCPRQTLYMFKSWTSRAIIIYSIIHLRPRYLKTMLSFITSMMMVMSRWTVARYGWWTRRRSQPIWQC